VEKSSPKIWAKSEIFKTLLKKRQSPNERKFGQSGHPTFYITGINFLLLFYIKNGDPFRRESATVVATA
jgi:hypothetical protein